MRVLWAGGLAAEGSLSRQNESLAITALHTINLGSDSQDTALEEAWQWNTPVKSGFHSVALPLMPSAGRLGVTGVSREESVSAPGFGLRYRSDQCMSGAW